MWVQDAQGRVGQWVKKVLGEFLGQPDLFVDDIVTTTRHLESDDPLPLSVDQITPAWLSKVLHTQVESLRVQDILHGSGSKVLVEATYSSSASKSSTNHIPTPPTHLCIKGGFNPDLVALLPSLLAVYRLEAQFYHHIAPRIPGLRLIPSYWCGVDHPSGVGQGIVVLQDIRAAGYTFGSPLRPWPVDRVRGALAQLAWLHAATWGAKQADFPWVPRASAMRDVVEGMMSEAHWAARFADPAVRPPGVPAVFWADRPRVVRCMRALWAAADPRLVCMVHGDTQVGNTFVDPAGRPGFLDWQCPHVNSAAHDVTYFMTGALAVADRRRHERALYGFYLKELCRAGGPKFEVEDVWDVCRLFLLFLGPSSPSLLCLCDRGKCVSVCPLPPFAYIYIHQEYRKYQMQGFAWALAGPMMQPKEIVDAMSERHCAAILDHNTLELLESLAEPES